MVFCGTAGLTPTSSMAASNTFIISTPPSSLHALSTTHTAAWKCLGWLSGTSGFKVVQRSKRSLQSCMGTHMEFAK